MSKPFDQPGISGTSDAPQLTIAERIEKGRETGSCKDGAIVPFPPGLRGQGILSKLGNFSAKLLMAGYQASFFEYRSTGNEVIQVVVRFDHPTERKEVRPVRYCGKSEMGQKVEFGAIEGQKPLYGLDRLAARPTAPVLVVEGEKTADAANKLFPDCVAITWMSGASSVRRAEMLLLAGRDLVLWPDNDQAGRSAMRLFAAFAFQAGALMVRMVDVPSEFGEKWDLADEAPPNLQAEYSITNLLETARPLTRAQIPQTVGDARNWAEQRRLLKNQPGFSQVGIEHAETALSLLDPGMPGNEWRAIARSIFYAFGDRGLPMFDAWSRGSDEKYREGEPTGLWAAYRTETTFRGKSLAWLFRKATAVLRARSAENGDDRPNIELDKQAIVAASIEELNEDHAVVVRGGKAGVLWENYDPRFKRYSETYLSKRDFTDLFVRKVVLADDDEEQNNKKNKSITQGNLWFKSGFRRSYEGVHFAPGEDHGPKFLNLWRGFTVDPTDDPAGWALFKEHLFSHVAGGNQTSYEYILNWLAFAVQHLDKPIGTALVLIGKKGAGKSIVTELFGHLFGQHTFVTSRMDDVLGRFNDRLETTVLLGLEEAVAPQNRAADGTLKDLITRQTLRLEGKFFGTWTAPNHLRIIVTSNNALVVRADGSERRYGVFEVTNPHQADPNERRRYFGRIVEQMEVGGYSAMLGELLARDVSHWNAEAIPETDALKRQKVLNLVNDPVRMYLYDRLQDGYFITNGGRDGTPIHLWHLTETAWIPCKELRDDFMEFVSSNGLRATDRTLATQLGNYMPEGFQARTKRGKDGDATPFTFKAYPFPPLEEARRCFEKATGLNIEREVAS